MLLLAHVALAQDAGTPKKANAPTVKGAAQKPGAASAPKRRVMAQPDHLPEELRLLLLRRMANHARDVSELMFSVLFLQYDDAVVLAKSIKEEPRLARPTPDDETINRGISSKFFTFQDDLRRRAGEVADSAAKKDSKAMGEAYGRMMQVCVSCHATYLEVDDQGPATDFH